MEDKNQNRVPAQGPSAPPQAPTVVNFVPNPPQDPNSMSSIIVGISIPLFIIGTVAYFVASYFFQPKQTFQQSSLEIASNNITPRPSINLENNQISIAPSGIKQKLPTPTPTPTRTPTPTPSRTPTPTRTPTPSRTPTSPPLPISTPFPTKTPTPTPIPGLTIEQMLPLCITISGSEAACNVDLFTTAYDSGVYYVNYVQRQGPCGKFDLQSGMVAIYDSYTEDHVDFGPKTTNWACPISFYTTEGYNYLKSQGKTPKAYKL